MNFNRNESFQKRNPNFKGRIFIIIIRPIIIVSLLHILLSLLLFQPLIFMTSCALLYRDWSL